MRSLKAFLGAMIILSVSTSTVLAADEQSGWLIGRRMNGVGIENGQQKPIEIVRLSNKFLVFRDQAKTGSKNVRKDVSENPFDELRADGKVWRLVNSKQGVAYQGSQLWCAFRRLQRDKAPGIDGVTVDQYEVNLRENLQVLETRLHRQTNRPQPIPKQRVGEK